METRAAEAPNAGSVTEKNQVANQAPDSPTGLTSRLQNLSIPQSLPKTTQFPFLLLPGEIRNKIYFWTFILSRSRSEIYDIPDYVVHGDSKSTSAIRWANISRFNLLLVCKQTFLEALPVISAESYIEIKVYVDESPRRRERKASAAFAALMRTRPLWADVGKAVLNVTPTDWTVDFDGDGQLPRLAGVLAGLPKLKDVTLKLRHMGLTKRSWTQLHGFFALCRRGVSLCFELLDYYADSGDEDEVEEMMDDHRAAELMIEKLARVHGGEGADVWVEWDIQSDDREYY